MKRLLLAGAALLALSAASPATAAPPPIFTWTGFYVGLNAGYSWGRTPVVYQQVDTISGFAFGFTGPATYPLSPDSFIGGGQAGWNFQSGMLVYGIETDIAWRNGSDTRTIGFNAFGDTLVLRAEQKWVGTLRARLGVTPASNWMIYATGGLAFGELEHFFSQFCPCGGTNGFRAFSHSETKAGWTVGAGLEVALSPSWSLGLEYLYMDFGSDTLSGAPTGACPPGSCVFSATTARFHDHSHVLRAKLNFRPI